MKSNIFFTIVLLLFFSNLKAGDYYWVGGNGVPGSTYANPASGDWGTLDNWRDANVGGNVPNSTPSLNDDVYINTPNASVVITIPFSEIFANNFNFNGAGKVQFLNPDINTINCNGTFSWIGSGELTMGTTSNLNIKGSLIIGPTSTINIQNTGSAINMIGSGGNHVINTNNKYLNVNRFNISPTNASTTYTFTSRLNTDRLNITSGLVDFGNLQYSLIELRSDNSGARNLNLNTSKITISTQMNLGGSGLVINPGLGEIILNNNAIFNFFSGTLIKLYKLTTNSTGAPVGPANIRSLLAPGALGFQNIEINSNLEVIASGISIDTLRISGGKSLALPVNEIFSSNNFSRINNAIFTSFTCNLPTIKNLGIGSVELRLGGNLTTTALATQNIQVSTGSLLVNTWADKGNNINISGNTLNIPKDYYWVNATGNRNWSNVNNWRIGSCSGTIPSCPPSFADNVFVTGCGPGIDRINMDIDGEVNNITWTNSVASNQLILTGSEDLNVFGKFDIQKSDLTVAYSGTLTFNGINNSLNTGTTALSSVININTSGTFNLLSNLQVNNILVHKFGTFKTNNFNITCQKFISGDQDYIYFISALCKPARTLDLGSTTIQVTASGTGSPFVIYGGNLDLPANSSNIIISGTGGINDVITATFHTTCQTKILNWNNLYFTGTGNFTQSIDLFQPNVRNIFNNIRFTENGRTSSNLTYDTLFIHSGKVYSFTASSAGIQHTINNTIEIEGNASCESLTFIQGITNPITLRKLSGNLTLNKVILRNINALGGATFNAIQSVNAGNVTGVNFGSNIPNQDYYWNNAAGGDWSDCSNWSLGSPSGPNPAILPSPVSNVFFSIPINGTVSVSSTSFCKNMTWSLPSGNVIFSGDKPLYTFGSVTLANTSILDWQYNGFIYFNSDNPGNTLQFNGQILNNNIYFSGVGEYTLISDLKLGKGLSTNDYYTIFLENGTFNSNNFAIQAGAFIASTNLNRTIRLGSSTITLLIGGASFNGINLNLQAGTSTIISNSSVSIQNSGLNFYNIIFNGNGTRNNLIYSSTNAAAPLPFYNKVTFLNNGNITGNHTYDTLEFSTGKTYRIASNSVQKIFNALLGSGTPCEYTTIQSSISGQTAGFFKVAGSNINIFQVNLIDISGLSNNPLDGTTTTSTYFAAGSSTSNGNTPGWNIGEPPGFLFGFGSGKTDSLLCTDFPYTIPTNTFYNPISYLWGDGSTQPNFIATKPGRYYLTVFYSNNCTYSDSINLFLNDTANFNFELRNPSCFNSNNGSIKVLPDDNQLHTYIWKNLTDTTASISNLISGNYTVTVNKGICSKTDTAEIFTDTIKVSLTPTDPGCFNNDGQIQANITNAQGNVSYIWNPAGIGNTALVSGLSGGQYSVQVIDDSSCITIDTTDLIFVPLPTISFNPLPDFCENDNNNFNLIPFASPVGGTFFGNGINGGNFNPSLAGAGQQLLSYEISNAKGCKDTASTNVLVNDTSIITINTAICELDSFLVGTTYFKNSGTFNTILIKSNGCDSLVILNLTVVPLSDTIVVPLTECDGNTILLSDGTSYTTDAIHTINYKNFVNCDSIIRFVMSFIPKIRDTVQRAICAGDVFNFGSRSLTSPGIYTDTFPSIVNCDSIVTLDLIVNPIPPITNINIQGCEGRTVTLPDGTNFTADGTHDIILNNYQSCDSTVRYFVTFVSTIRVNIKDSICDNQTFTLGTQVLNTTGTYTETFVSFAGCDSVVTLDLLVHPTYPLRTVLFEPCENDTFLFPDATFTTVNTQKTFTFNTIFGCDSTIRYDVQFKPIRRQTLNQTICANEFFNLNGNNLNISGTYIDTIASSLNCDSIITLNLNVVPLPDTSILNITQCLGDIFTYPDGTTITASGTKDFKLFTSNNCDSIVRYIVAFVDKIRVTVFDTICANQSYNFGGISYNTSGIYFDTLPSSIGCDSIVTLRLQVNPLPAIFNILLQPCEGDTVRLPDNSAFTTNATKDIIIPNFQNCDSTIRYTIQFIPRIRTTKDTAVCEGQFFTFGTRQLNIAGTYIDTFPALSGCDSIVTLRLSIISINISVDNSVICQDQNALFSISNTGVSNISWFRDNTNLGLNSTSISVNTAGNYYAIAAQGTGCRDTSNILNLTVQPTPFINLGPDQLICRGDTAQFDATFAGATYTWNNGKSTSTISETNSGIFSVIVNLNNCLFRDTAELTVQELPVVNLGPDFSACIDSFAILSNNNVQGTYLWSDGSAANTLRVTTNGTYGLQVTQGICKNSDSITVTFELDDPVVALGPDTSFCINRQVTIGADVSNALQYAWNTGASTAFIDVNKEGIYLLKVTNQCGSAIDSIFVKQENCDCGVFIPTAFSPNGSGINDKMAPIVTCLLTDFYFVIYNRWNQKMFETNLIGTYWDGTKNGTDQPLDTYIFYLKYKLDGEDVYREEKGSFVLLR